VQILSMMLLYPLLRRRFDNRRIFFISMGMCAAGYAVLLALTFTEMKSVFLLFIPGFFIFATNGVNAILTTVFLANTVDYGELKNNRRDESVIFSMQTFVVKLASGVAAFIASICLQLNRLSDAAVSEADKAVDFSATVSAGAKLGLRMTMTVAPIALIVFSFLWFRRKYTLTDERVAEIAAQVKARRERE
jgi:melibiose permease